MEAKGRFGLWVLALIPLLALIGLGAGLLSDRLGSASLLITLPVVALVAGIFARKMARSVFGPRNPPPGMR